MRYVDGFVLPLKKKNLPAYRRIARLAGKVWREHGALEYVECIGDSFVSKMGGETHTSIFPKVAQVKSGETVVFSWITYKSKGARDRIMKKVMKDPRLAEMMDPAKMPFDMKRMAWGGFKTIVDV